MAKQIVIHYKDDTYTLEYTRAAVKQMERAGFVADEFEHKPMTMLPMLFEGAFIAHHPQVKRAKIEQIYDSLNDKAALIERLVEMYSEPFEALMDDAGEGNANWTPVG